MCINHEGRATAVMTAHAGRIRYGSIRNITCRINMTGTTCLSVMRRRRCRRRHEAVAVSMTCGTVLTIVMVLSAGGGTVILVMVCQCMTGLADVLYIWRTISKGSDPGVSHKCHVGAATACRKIASHMLDVGLCIHRVVTAYTVDAICVVTGTVRVFMSLHDRSGRILRVQ